MPLPSPLPLPSLRWGECLRLSVTQQQYSKTKPDSANFKVYRDEVYPSFYKILRIRKIFHFNRVFAMIEEKKLKIQGLESQKYAYNLHLSLTDVYKKSNSLLQMVLCPASKNKVFHNKQNLPLNSKIACILPSNSVLTQNILK